MYIFTYQIGLGSKNLFCEMFLNFNFTSKYIWGRILSAKFNFHKNLTVPLLYMTSPMQNMTGQFTMLRRFLHMTSLKQSKIIQTPLLMRFLNKTSPKQIMTTQSKLQMWILHTTSLQLLIPQTMDYPEGAIEGARRSLHALILRIFRRNKSTKLYFVNLWKL